MATMLHAGASSSSRRLLSLSRARFSPLFAAAVAVAGPRSSSSPLVSPETPSAVRRMISVSGRGPFNLSSRCSFSATTSQLPHITDPDIETAFKDLMAMSWDEIPRSVVSETKKALSKMTNDKAGQEALANVFRAAEAAVEFGGVLVSLRMLLDDLGGLTGENMGCLPGYLEDALKSAYKHYMTYLDSFGPDETYLRKKA